MAVATTLERYMFELVNTDRTNLGLSPLVLETNLNTSADTHTAWMISADIFSHTGDGNSTATERMIDADFDFSGSWRSAENLAAVSVSGYDSLFDEVLQLHNNLMNSTGHRANLLNPDLTYIGIGIDVGPLTYDTTSGPRAFDSVLVTQNFAATQGTGDPDIQGESVPIFINGDSGDDHIDGGNGNDSLTGGAGSDTLAGVDGDDTLIGGSDDDYVHGNGGNDTVDGGGGDDTVIGGPGDDRVLGGAGHDELTGGNGRDTLLGGGGDDLFFAQAGDDYVVGGDGIDSVHLGIGSDVYEGNGSGGDVVRGLAGHDTITGGSDGDLLLGHLGLDVISGEGGNDTIRAGIARDIISGGDGDDLLDAAPGWDVSGWWCGQRHADRQSGQ